MIKPLYDSVIVGAGPGGLSAAMMLGRARRRVLVIEDATPRNRFTSHMHAVLGFDGAPPEELIRRARLELAQYDVTVAAATAIAVEEDGDHLLVHTSRGLFRARTIVNAVGAADELAPIDGIEQLWGQSVLHCPYCHGWEVREKRLAVIATPLMGSFRARLLRQWSPSLTAFVADAGAPDEEDLRQLSIVGAIVNTSPVVSVTTRADGALDITTADGAVTAVDAIFTGSTLVPRDHYLPPDLARTDSGFVAVDQSGRTTHPKIWTAGNAASPYANVPMSMGNGSAVGGAVNLALVEEDLAESILAASEGFISTVASPIACNYRP